MTSVSNRIKTYMEQYIDSWPFSGTILVAQEGEILYKLAHGHANIEHEVINSPTTKFGIWSITKSFTAMAIMMLAQQKLLRLDDPLSDYLPAFKKVEMITIRHLMQHESGLVNSTNLPEYNANLNKWPLSREQFLSVILEYPLDFSPGSQFSYNNTGYYLLGIIIEKLSGLTFEQFVTNRILEPLGMTNTGMNDSRRLISGLASSYDSSGYEPVPSEFIDMYAISSAGCMYSTIEDLYKWDQAFYSSQLLSQEVLHETFHSDNAKYGLGWFLDECNNQKRIYHGGAYRGYRSELHRYPQSKVTVIILTNYDFVPVTMLAEVLAGIVFGEDVTVPQLPQSFSLSPEKINEFIGTYEGFGCKAVVERDGDDLLFVWNDRISNPIYPISDTIFQHKWTNKSYSFKYKPDGTLSFLGLIKTE
ncbi:serine hydrolase [Paenibacillus sp. L3-i20]|uniref:serine hydrolase domain-containing protein n=1 Tax=Paenibacillus sp. L3-i20 TaxID=2905833 RepID=UPI001EDDD903|nr:serine hydrolase domain-containing protein [Paenibacillus sp. L3-i20]GKU79456.1 serine hydrolase [Paenibacillus sp. L3-i20]